MSITYLTPSMHPCRLNVTFTYAMPAVGNERGKKMNATQVAVLKVQRFTMRHTFCVRPSPAVALLYVTVSRSVSSP